eukprot:5318120-Pleurochrysis_carterae.AAC.2
MHQVYIPPRARKGRFRQLHVIVDISCHDRSSTYTPPVSFTELPNVGGSTHYCRVKPAVGVWGGQNQISQAFAYR